MKRPQLMLAAAIVGAALTGACGVETLEAQKTISSFKRTLLDRHDLSAPGREAVQVLAEFSPGSASGRHSHPGEEIGYVLEGAIFVEVKGQKPVILEAGAAFFIPAGVVHEERNAGTAPAKVLSTYVVEKGKPIATSVR